MNILVNGIDMTHAEKVLLITPEQITLKDCIELKRQLDINFPNTKFVLLTGDFQVVKSENFPLYEIEAR